MENSTREIIHVATIDKRETNWNSVVMEKEGFVKMVKQLTKEIKIVEICTDAHSQINALMSKYWTLNSALLFVITIQSKLQLTNQFSTNSKPYG